MKKIKIGLYIFLLLLLTGCTAEVNIDLKEDYLVEKITIVDKEGTKDEISKRYRRFVPAYYDDIVADELADEKIEGFTYYNRSSQELSDGYAFTYSRTFKLNEYNKASSFKSTFRSGAVEYSNEEGTIDIYTDSNGLLIFDTYPNLYSVKVNITTKQEVLDNNADEVKGHTYSWTINRNDKERNIYLQAKNNRYEEIHKTGKESKIERKQTSKKKTSNGMYLLIILLSIIGFLVFVVFLNSIASKLGR